MGMWVLARQIAATFAREGPGDHPMAPSCQGRSSLRPAMRS